MSMRIQSSIVVHNTAQNSSDNLPYYPADKYNHHSSGNYLLERGGLYYAVLLLTGRITQYRLYPLCLSVCLCVCPMPASN